jgi:hypothetical protein
MQKTLQLETANGSSSLGISAGVSALPILMSRLELHDLRSFMRSNTPIDERIEQTAQGEYPCVYLN